MKKAISLLFFLFIVFSLNSQEHPDLGLHGLVTWLDDTHIRVEYDWTDDAQMNDWITTSGSTLIREPGIVTVSGGNVSVRSMIWQQPVKCTRILAEDVVALSVDGHHLNFYADLDSFDGTTYLPDPGLGAILADYKNFWVHDGTEAGDIGAPYIVVGQPEDYELTFSTTGMTISSSANDIVYSYNNPCTPGDDRKIALGGWRGDTRWGKIIIEGEITLPDAVPSDVINFQSSASVFAPVIEVKGSPVIEWIFDDGTTSSSPTPVKDYGSPGSRRNYLKVSPWSALIGINTGYDASDGGYGDFDMVQNQNILKFDNLGLAKDSLQYLCASYNPLTELDLTGFTELQFIELFRCVSLTTLKLDYHPVLERLCVENCHLSELDLSGCPALGDLRGALNAYTAIEWGTIGDSVWHICIRDNPQMIQNLPDLSQFPALTELLNWNTSQTGPLVCNSNTIRQIESYNNNYTSVDVSNSANLWRLYLSGNSLTSIDIGNGLRLYQVKLDNCNLSQSQVDYVLKTLDAAGRSNGTLDLTSNAAPSIEGITYMGNLIAKGWTVEIMTGLEVPVSFSAIKGIILSEDELRITLDDGLISWDAGLYNMGGIQVLQQLINSDEIVFNISSLAPGMYIIELSDGTQKHTKKIIIP